MNKFTLCVAFLFGTILYCQAQRDNETPYQVKQFTVSGKTAVKAETVGGNISVTGQQGNDARVEMYVRGSSSNSRLSEDEIRERLENFDITISQEGNTIVASAKPKRNINWNNKGISVSFKVYVPRETSTDLNATGGNISLAGLSGKQEAETSGGNISLGEITGDARVETAGGNISIGQYEGKLDVNCSGGNISLDNARGEIKVSTAGGNINVSGVAGSVEAHTSGGNIRAKVTEVEKYLTLSTSGGNITASIPENKGIDLDIRADRISSNLREFKGYLGKEKIEGSINGGGIPVKMRTSGGNISLN